MTANQDLLDWFGASPGGEVVQTVRLDDSGPPGITLDTLLAAHPGRREHLLGDYLCQELGRVLHYPAEAVDREQTMTDLGVGSMIGLELRNRIQEALGVAPGVTAILRAESVRELVRRLERLLA